MTQLDDILQLRISLRASEPAIWRRLLVPASYTLADLHFVIQTAFGWENCHLHQFELGQRIFAPRLDEPEPSYEDEDAVVLRDLFKRRAVTLVYQYDLGARWIHDVELEKTLRPRAELAVPSCSAGERAGPPEDVGGIRAFNALAAALRSGPEAAVDERVDPELLAWLREDFDPTYFVADEVNELFARYGDLQPDDDGKIDEGTTVYSDGRLFNYDAASEPGDWEKWDPDERVLAVEEYHRCQRPHQPADDPKMHAVFHTIAESQLSEANPPEIRTVMDRLQAEGLDRHEAIHAIGAVAAEMLYDAMEQGREPDVDAYCQALNDLSAQAWLLPLEPDLEEKSRTITKQQRPSKYRVPGSSKP